MSTRASRRQIACGTRHDLSCSSSTNPTAAAAPSNSVGYHANSQPPKSVRSRSALGFERPRASNQSAHLSPGHLRGFVFDPLSVHRQCQINYGGFQFLPRCRLWGYSCFEYIAFALLAPFVRHILFDIWPVTRLSWWQCARRVRCGPRLDTRRRT
jgi:hypothetical protein